MLKVLDKLEMAVDRLVETAEKSGKGKPISGPVAAAADDITEGLGSMQSEDDRGEAAELIRRAIKRLRSL